MARALVSRPKAVFADEPTGNLDSHASREVLELLRRAVDEFRQTVVMVTHDEVAAGSAAPAMRSAVGVMRANFVTLRRSVATICSAVAAPTPGKVVSHLASCR